MASQKAQNAQQAPSAASASQPEPMLVALLDSSAISAHLTNFLHDVAHLAAQGRDAAQADLNAVEADVLEAAVAGVRKDVALPLTADAVALRGTTIPALFARLHAALGDGRTIIAPFINLPADEVEAAATAPAAPAEESAETPAPAEAESE